MIKTKKIKEIPTIVTYLGMQGYPSSSHVYMVNNNEDIITFKRKLQKHHRIGLSYPVLREGNTYKSKKSDYSIDKPGFKISAQRIAECVRTTEAIQTHIKAKNEQNRLASIARDFAEKMRPAYRRADDYGKIAMIRAFVEKLEEL